MIVQTSVCSLGLKALKRSEPDSLRHDKKHIWAFQNDLYTLEAGPQPES